MVGERFGGFGKWRNAPNAVENLYRANEVYVAKGDARAAARRLEYQRQALVELKLLAYMGQLAMEQGCILSKQYEQITRKAYDCRNLLVVVNR